MRAVIGSSRAAGVRSPGPPDRESGPGRQQGRSAGCRLGRAYRLRIHVDEPDQCGAPRGWRQRRAAAPDSNGLAKGPPLRRHGAGGRGAFRKSAPGFGRGREREHCRAYPGTGGAAIDASGRSGSNRRAQARDLAGGRPHADAARGERPRGPRGGLAGGCRQRGRNRAKERRPAAAGFGGGRAGAVRRIDRAGGSRHSRLPGSDRDRCRGGATPREPHPRRRCAGFQRSRLACRSGGPGIEAGRLRLVPATCATPRRIGPAGRCRCDASDLRSGQGALRVCRAAGNRSRPELARRCRSIARNG